MSFQYVSQQQPEQKPKGSNQTMLILLGLAVMVILGAAVLVAAFVLAPKTPAGPVSTASPDVPTAREAYVPAVTLIREKDAGAVLLTAMGAWTPAINRAELQEGRTGWTFYFYLPTTSQLAAVTVNKGGSALISEVKAWATLPDTLDEERWQLDSGAAIANFVGSCQNSLGADTRVLAVFTTSADNSSLIWDFQALSADGSVACQVKVDAQSGAVRQ